MRLSSTDEAGGGGVGSVADLTDPVLGPGLVLTY